mgnify:FL=1
MTQPEQCGAPGNGEKSTLAVRTNIATADEHNYCQWVAPKRKPNPKPRVKARPRLEKQLENAMRYVANALPLGIRIKAASVYRGEDHSGDTAVFVTIIMTKTSFDRLHRSRMSMIGFSLLVNDEMHNEGVEEYVYVMVKVA